MKFTQNEAAKKISSILTRGGKDLQMSERSINENLDSLMKLLVNDETELDDFISKVRPIFETMNNNAKKDFSDFANKWKEEHPENEQPSVNNSQDTTSSPSENPELTAALKRIAALEKLNEDNAKRNILAQKRKDVEKKLKESGIKDDEWIELQLSKVNFDKELDLDKEAEDYVKLYNKSKANSGAGIVPGQAGPSSNEVDYKKQFDAIRERAKRARASINLKTDL